jgi:heme/copper-type cytochrome/quinol oxidase subunit 2
MTNISEAVLNKIKKYNIKPRGRWEFLLKDYFVWALCVLFVIVGGLAISVIMHLLNNNDWDLYRNLGGSFWHFLLMTLPYFWIILFVLFVSVVYYNIRHTNKGYHYPLSVIIIISMTASIALGGAFYNLGMGHELEESLANAAGPYNRIICHGTVVWHNPAAGMVVGEVTDVRGQICYLVDMDGNRWEIHTDNANLVGGYFPQPGDRVKVMGRILNPGVIYADDIRPVSCACNMAPPVNMPHPPGCGCPPERKINRGRIMMQRDVVTFNYQFKN